MVTGCSSLLPVLGTDVHAVEWQPSGGASTTRGEPMLLVHGLGANTHSWDPVGQLLADRRGARVIAIDLAGFGRTRATNRPATLGANAELVIGALERLGPAVVAGNSMGGALTVKVAARRPDLVQAMVLVDPALPAPGAVRAQSAVIARFSPVMIRPLGTRVLRARARRLGPEGLVDDALGYVVADPRRIDPDLRERLVAVTALRMGFPEAPQAYVDAASSLFWYLARNVHRDLARAAKGCPGLIVHGALDRLVNVGCARRVVARHPAYRLEVLPGTGHAPQLEVPERFVDVVDRWLTEVQVGSPQGSRTSHAVTERGPGGGPRRARQGAPRS